MKHLILTSLLLLAAYSVIGAQNQTGTIDIEGQIICCRDCWAKADRKTVPYGTGADLAQAAACIAKGDPTLLAAMGANGETTFYQLEEGKFKHPGKNWLELVGKRVAVAGVTRSRREVRYLKVDELKVLASPEFPAGLPRRMS
ncbi:MAG TPA: hypothetical protein VNS63_09355 [Blastocatellia bacterium]|nr:hypothetical protein [Blastocatellia bacterium]